MSMFENDQYRWRETYFVLFDSRKRPTLKALLRRLASLGGHFTIANPTADEEGYFESLTVLSPDDFAAMDVCYASGEEVQEQMDEIIKDLTTPDCERADRDKLKRLATLDGRFDVLHFEQMLDDSEDPDDMFDPSGLLIVLDALVEMTDGIAVDPQSGAML